jgi:hypothetical protein
MRWLVLVAGLSACGAPKETADTGPTTTPPTDTDTEPTDTEPVDTGCGDTAPYVFAVTTSAAGLQKSPEGELLPAMLFAMEVIDDDGDLDHIGYELWYDEVVDGVVDTAVPAPVIGNTTLAGDPCGVGFVALNLTVTTDGGGMKYATEMDFALVASDARGNHSAPFVFAAWVPDENGDDATP